MTSQQNRLWALETVLGSDTLLVAGFSGSEAISSPFSFHVDLLSENDSIDLKALIGTNVTLRVAQADDSPRFWNGHISGITQGWKGSVFTAYRAEIVPWLWFLGSRSDCRIFQNKTAVDIIREVFEGLGFQDFVFRLNGSFPTRDYCVQYRETDLNFVSRLMEEEGIFYFFEHQQGRHQLVMGNVPEVHQPCPGQSSVRCELATGGVEQEDLITDWRMGEAFVPSSLSLTDFNFKTPAAKLRVSLDGENPFEIYDHPGQYEQPTRGEQLTRIRLQEIQAFSTNAHGESTCRAFTTGFRFKLDEHYRESWNQWYVLTEIRHSAHQGGNFMAGDVNLSLSESVYRNEFVCIPHQTPFRPSRRTLAPLVEGCQTAIVVGPQNEEIYTDKYGRVKVQFHWDRLGKKNEQSSCWIRVSQSSAGKDWGAISIPRIGQEVVVDFLEGNPDRPLITGRVYNAATMPPYTLPAGADMMGFKSNSTKGGGGYNEIVIKDGKGSELIRIHAQKDMETKVLHDQKEVVKSNKNLHIVQELRTLVEQKVSHTVKGDVAEHFQSNHAEVVDAERYLKANRIILEAATEICIKVGGNHVHISPAGIDVQGTIVNINCGKPPSDTTLSGLVPTTPDDPA